MAKTLLDLAKRLEKKAEALEKSASDLAVKITLTIIGDLTFKTPVDTSKALSNWIVTLNRPTKRRIDAHFPGKQGSSQVQSSQQTFDLAKAILENKKPGQIIFITNNQPYIRRLNEGYSAQAPAGFVERSVLIGRKSLKKFKIKG